MGTMFFANPVAAMRNVIEALEPGGKLCMIVWRRKLDNPFMFRSEEIVDKYVAHRILKRAMRSHVDRTVFDGQRRHDLHCPRRSGI